jgi:hypothetical protein
MHAFERILEKHKKYLNVSYSTRRTFTSLILWHPSGNSHAYPGSTCIINAVLDSKSYRRLTFYVCNPNKLTFKDKMYVHNLA